MTVFATPKIRVLCVDDHPLVRDGIAFALQMQRDIELVGEAANGEEAVEGGRPTPSSQYSLSSCQCY